MPALFQSAGKALIKWLFVDAFRGRLKRAQGRRQASNSSPAAKMHTNRTRQHSKARGPAGGLGLGVSLCMPRRWI
jgi:hypothetical protein